MMKHIATNITFFVQLAKTQAIVSNLFDRALGGLSFTEFLILLHLVQAPERQLSRIDLAKKIGLTASGITRLLLPMVKIGLVKNGPQSEDARVRTVMASSSGRQKLSEELARLKFLADDILPPTKQKELETFSELLVDIGGRASMK